VTSPVAEPSWIATNCTAFAPAFEPPSHHSAAAVNVHVVTSDGQSPTVNADQYTTNELLAGDSGMQ
jgi:hypothetical protein